MLPVFLDSDIEVTNTDLLTYDVTNSNAEVINTSINEDLLQIQFLSSGIAEIYLTALDQYNVFL